MARYIDANKIDFSSIKDASNRIITKLIILNQPTADVEEVRHGEWIDKEYFGVEVPVCSVCESESTHYEYHSFCPNCGAKMDGGKAE